MSNTSATEEPEFKVPPSLAGEWMSMAEAMTELSFTRWHISDLCKDGVLQRQRYGRHVLINRQSVAKYMARFKTPLVKTTKRKRRA